MKRTRFDSYVRAINALAEGHGEHFDANETAMFARQLEDIDSELYRVQYRSCAVGESSPCARPSTRARRSTPTGSWTRRASPRIIANYSEDLPRVDVQGREVTVPLFGHGAAYGYSIQDMRRSRMTGLPLDAERAETGAGSHRHQERLHHRVRRGLHRGQGLLQQRGRLPGHPRDGHLAHGHG